ncbi:T9SS type A sorting domain-containing protein [Flavobacterium rakeshii]|uniref:T9SS type A sorting domain-containing protein n=1 Tax=Flavobacterium rakeshii TaxID=1038845 RepID=A0A6N8HGP6_9FLAO|nr:T9SS type A sorting domain-containing protein [Flavobacterium rakeshii]MEE1897593.1 T9SS type A sorting domain-containing protein [Flavobacterium rakeshii]MUV04816.1 T9SS type A sorting domain-containing protein [Flavobacterium rakeshii]
MKKLLLLGLMLVGTYNVKAQQFPTFSAEDINGNQHSVQDYLAEGKTVLLDISATWCAPCWNFHNAHTLEKIYETYGPGGSDEVVVIFVEGDPWTPENNIYGEGTSINYSPPRPPIGDWTIGVPYPIINDDNLINAVGLTGFPSLYRICPDGTYAQIPNSQMGDIQNIINSMNVCGTLEGASNHAKLDSEDIRVCVANGDAAASASFTNYGTNAITTATFNIKNSANEVVATKEYTGSVAMYGSATVTFDDAAYATGEYTVEIASINGEVPFAEASKNINVIEAAETSINAVVKVYTDYYPGEISWAIKDSNGTTVANGGPYQPGNAEFGGGGADANTTKTHYVVLPEAIDCYSVVMYDEFGDGWIYGSTPHGIEIFSHDGTVSIFQKLVGSLDFGDELTTNSAFKTNGILGNETFETAKFSIYPNPTNGILNFATQEEVNVSIVDLTGKVVFTASKINDGDSINLSSLQAGMYIAKIKGTSTERIEKIVIK